VITALRRTPLFKGRIAMALVKRGSAAIGDRLSVVIRVKAVTATVVKRPFSEYTESTHVNTMQQRREL